MTAGKSSTPMECAEFQQQLPGVFDSGVSLTDHPHLKSCTLCSSLVRDLEYIAAQAKLMLPIHDPSPAVWENIQNALQQDGKQSKDRP